ncbi:hypothetical protein [Chryseobacterium sp. 3008163]|uniref:hypothetical protein n=1 Tax=Chryseobacterium sp. 3008163 TaxID=2478663 RepID=UPI000F0D0B54|nr:hypothetical protein [Chryseobacterium sp. 3008163]AYM99624.1 hypothetical protein EAG08_04070 [Chryseobacterium sp. 3008163]
MKYKILLTLLLLTTFAFGQNVKFNIKYSEQLAVFVFMQNISENYRGNVFKTEFQKSKYNTEHYKNILSKFDKLTIDYSYAFDEFPYGSKIPMQTRDILKKNLIETTTLNDFKLRSIGIVPNKTLSDLTEMISTFTPIYNELIYNPNKIQFEKQLVEISKYSKEHKIEDFFETGLLFYNSTWNNSIPFEIAFYPLPNSQSFTAQAFYNNFISAIQTNLKDYKNLFSVMLHETFHIIYDEQPLGVKNDIDKYFKENKSKNSNYSYQILNEVLATALGNGYVYEKLDGKIDSNDWYYHQYIDLLARKIYPLVTDYISQKKPMDRSFIDNYIKIYDGNFPNWINELENVMAYRYVISENQDDFNSIRKIFWYRSSEDNDTEITENSIEKMRKTPLTKVIIVSKNNKEKLSLIKKKFAQLKNWNFEADKDFSYKILLEDKSQLIILNQKKSTIEALIKTVE